MHRRTSLILNFQPPKVSVYNGELATAEADLLPEPRHTLSLPFAAGVWKVPSLRQGRSGDSGVHRGCGAQLLFRLPWHSEASRWNWTSPAMWRQGCAMPDSSLDISFPGRSQRRGPRDLAFTLSVALICVTLDLPVTSLVCVPTSLACTPSVAP